MTHNEPKFFGYGSLVNAGTHAYTAAPATLKGWRRVWCHTDARPIAFLSVLPAEGDQIDGIIAPVPNADWHALDRREHAYARVPVAHQITGPDSDIAVYCVPTSTFGTPSLRHPILRKRCEDPMVS